MKIAICDDEKFFREQLHRELESYYCSLDVLIDAFSSGWELMDAINKMNYDLLFLDIEMEGMDGLEVARKLQENETAVPIIFLTSHTELAMAGYEVQAFRFLAKPIEQRKLLEALQAFENNIERNSRIMIVEGGMQHYLSCKDIFYIKSENVYLKIVMKKETYLIRKKLKELLQELPSNLFVAVHRSYILNLEHVTGFDGAEVILEDGSRIPVSKSNRNTFKQQMIRYMKGKS